MNNRSLLVLGNGFDMHCELNSSFTDFFCTFNDNNYNILKQFNKILDQIKEDWDNHSRNKLDNNNGTFYGDIGIDGSYVFNLIYYLTYYPSNFTPYNYKHAEVHRGRFNEIKNDLVKLKNDNQLNFWILYLCLSQSFNDNLNWMDIESKLESFFKHYYIYIEKFLSTIFNFQNYGTVNDPEGELSKELVNIFIQGNSRYHIDNKGFLDIHLMILSLLLTHDFNSNNYNLYNVLLFELEKFENDFSDYLKKISKSKIYLNNVKSTLNYLKDREESDTLNIISFNYTNFDQVNNIKHVHSTIKDDNHPSGHPIIGIDSNDNFDKDYYMFTKTYRIMSLSNTGEYNNNILADDIKKIIFYGHSLSKADYSYFISIFDYYNIYANEIELIFYYSDDFKGKNNEKEQIKRSYYDSVYNLINEYGKTISHGKNLLHKMLLESRLHIRKMPALQTYIKNH